MLPTYQIRIKDWAGSIVAVYAGRGTPTDFLNSLYYTKQINQIGVHNITFMSTAANLDVLYAKLKLDYIVEIWRKYAVTAPWVRDYVGMHRSAVFQDTAEGAEQLVLYGHDLKGLIARRIVDAAAASVGSDKTGYAEDVVKEYVNENAGPGAALDRILSLFTVEASAGLGPVWTGSSARAPLIDVVQEICMYAGLDFDVVMVDPIGFNFTIVDGSLNDYTLGNTQGHAPIIFSGLRNNMLDRLYSVTRGDEITCFYILGDGVDALRTVIVGWNPTTISDSPWNRIEAARQASNDTSVPGMTTLAGQLLYENGIKVAIQFTAKQAPTTVYGRDYHLGYIVTGIYHEYVNKKITGIAVTVNADGESIAPEVADVIRR